jgi:hypothetical protein
MRNKQYVNKRSQQKCFSAALAFALQIGQNGGCNRFSCLIIFSKALKIAMQFCRNTLSLEEPCAKSCYALPPHVATIVLPDFARSLFAGKDRVQIKSV